MSLTYGFYNSIVTNGTHDRTYDATDFSKIFSGIITDGIFSQESWGGSKNELFALKASGGMTISVGTGRAWFNDTWTHNDSAFPITLSTGHATLKRIDVIVLTVDKGNRINSIGVVPGTSNNGGLGNTPSVPSINSGYSTITNYRLGYVTIPAGATAITQSMIKVTPLPYVTSVLKCANLETTGLYAQWDAQFNEWFEDIQSRLDGSDVASINSRIDGIIDNGVSKLTNSRSLDGVNFNGTAAVKHYYLCDTPRATSTKWVSVSNFTLVEGAYILVKFNNGNSATLADLKLQVNSNTAKPIKYKGETIPFQLEYKGVYLFVYDGTNFEVVIGGSSTSGGSYVPISRTVNGKALSSNITLTGEDIQSSTTSGRTITEAIDSKVDKVAGKVLSSWDLTTARKNKIDNCATQSSDGVMSAADKKKLDGIATNANKYILPPASSEDIGGIGLSQYATVWRSELNNPYLVLASSTYDGLMSRSDKNKLDNIVDNIPVATGLNKGLMSDTAYNLLTKLNNNAVTVTTLKNRFEIVGINVVSNRNIASGDALEGTANVNPDGLEVLGIVGHNISGTNSNMVNLPELYIDYSSSPKKISYRLRNQASSTATVTLAVRVLCVYKS